MVAETDVVNAALRLIGATVITTLTDGTKNAEVASDLYEEVRDDLLRSHPWNFATKRVKLARSATAPAFEFDYAYPMPADWLRTITVHDNDAGTGTILYREEEVNGQTAVVTSREDVYLRYVFQQTDPNKMAPDFRRALQFALARELAVPIANSNTLENQLGARADKALARARSADGMGGFPESRPRGSWASARGGRWPRSTDWQS